MVIVSREMLEKWRKQGLVAQDHNGTLYTPLGDVIVIRHDPEVSNFSQEIYDKMAENTERFLNGSKK